MSTDPPSDLPPAGPPIDAYRNWKPEYRAKALSLLQQYDTHDWKPFYCPDALCDGNHHIAPDGPPLCPDGQIHDWVERGARWVCADCLVTGSAMDTWLFRHARSDQRPPKWSDPWYVWLILSGRGTGKTLTGSRLFPRVVKKMRRSIIIGPTIESIRETMIEGETGIMAHSQPGQAPVWEPSKKKLTWANGAVTHCYSGEEPERLRGPNSGFIWIDEPAHIPLIEECWSNALLGHRMDGRDGSAPKILCTTTPLPTKWVKKLIERESTVITRVSTTKNLRNLAKTYYENVVEPLIGTTKGRQELHGEVLLDITGSLWKYEMIVRIAEEKWPDFVRIVVSVDPAGSANLRSDETGIIVVAIDAAGTRYVLEDLTGKFSPDGWAKVADAAYIKWSADAIVCERNYGGDMVRSTLEKVSEARIVEVVSRRGKQLRAEPIVANYERGEVLHAEGLELLEDEQCSWIPGYGASPNRVDALVHGLTELNQSITPSSISNPNDILKGMLSPTNRLRTA